MANPTFPTAKGPQEMAGNVADKAHNAASSVADKARDAASSVADKAKDVAGNVGDKAREYAGQAVDHAKDFGKSASHMAEHAAGNVGSTVQSFAGQLRDHAPKEGVMHDAASHVADTLERGGRYLQEEGLSGMTDDLTDVIKRNPIPAVLVGIGIGYLIAHALRR